MKSPTSHLRAVKRSLKKAEKIVSGVDPNQTTTDLQRLKVRSFIMLTHAALEEYFETISKSVAMEARKAFIERGTICHCLMALISLKAQNGKTDSEKRDNIKNLSKNIDDFSKEALNQYINIINNNHGIRKQNLNNILLPIGIDIEYEDILLSNALDTFGSTRGNVAHKFHHIQTEPTLSSIKTELQTIENNLIDFDKAVCSTLRYKKQIRPT
ncbi:HEPN domain-containing protein [Kiloniella sp. b19]|uniref:HEPN domain-containing protein n=1 Tax=Kiloniella sp. GXU_MW_B19 TaxID=3141326 RepID=UPI0031DDE776